MEFKKLIRREDRAVSPVIGVILMVAITVILAAVIGAFVLGLGDSLDNTAPTSSISMSVNSDYEFDGTEDEMEVFIMNHNGGDSVNTNDLRVLIRDEDGAVVGSFERSEFTSQTVDVDGTTVDMSLQYNGGSPDDQTFSTGDSLTIDDVNGGAGSGGDNLPDQEYRVQIVHVPSDSTLAESTLNG